MLIVAHDTLNDTHTR